ncbi:MAG: hypothetical protein Q6363_004415 [Candidatus Njordarchaeota archaeon]
MPDTSCCKMLEETEKLLFESLSKIDNVDTSYLRDSALSLVALALLKSGRLEDAKRYASKIADDNLRSLTLRKIDIFNPKQSLLDNSFSSVDRFDNIVYLLERSPSEQILHRAVDLINEIDNPIDRDDLISKIIFQYVKNNNLRQALDLASRIEDPINRGSIMGIIAMHYIKTDRDQGKKLFWTAVDLILSAKEIIDVGDKGKFYVRDIKTTLRKIVEAEKIAIKMKQVGLGSDANMIINKLLEIVEKIEEKDYRIDALRFMLRTAFQSKIDIDLQRVVSLAQNLIEEIENEYVKSQVLKEIGLYLARSGSIEFADNLIQRSISLAKNVKEDFQRESLLKEIAMDSLKAGLMGIPVVILNIIEDKKFKIDILVELFQHYVYRGFEEKANDTIKEAIEIANSIIQPEWKARALKQIIIALGKMKRCEQMFRLLEKLRDTIEQIPNIYSQITIIADTTMQIYETLYQEIKKC